MHIIENNIRLKLCWSSIQIAQIYVQQFKILRYKRHVLWKKYLKMKSVWSISGA